MEIKENLFQRIKWGIRKVFFIACIISTLLTLSMFYQIFTGNIHESILNDILIILFSVGISFGVITFYGVISGILKLFVKTDLSASIISFAIGAGEYILIWLIMFFASPDESILNILGFLMAGAFGLIVGSFLFKYVDEQKKISLTNKKNIVSDIYSFQYGSKVGIIQNEEIIVPALFTSIHLLNEEMILCKSKTKSVLLNYQGLPLIRGQGYFKSIRKLSDNLYEIRKSKRNIELVTLASDGKITWIPFIKKIEKINDFYYKVVSRYLRIVGKKKFRKLTEGLISKNGEIFFKPEYDMVLPIEDIKNEPHVKTDLIGLWKENSVEVIDSEGKKFWGYEFESISDFYGKYAIVRKENKFGLINREGHLIAEPIFNNIMLQGDGIFKVKLNNDFFVVDENGNKIETANKENETQKRFESIDNSVIVINKFIYNLPYIQFTAVLLFFISYLVTELFNFPIINHNEKMKILLPFVLASTFYLNWSKMREKKDQTFGVQGKSEIIKSLKKDMYLAWSFGGTSFYFFVFFLLGYIIGGVAYYLFSLMNGSYFFDLPKLSYFGTLSGIYLTVGALLGTLKMIFVMPILNRFFGYAISNIIGLIPLIFIPFEYMWIYILSIIAFALIVSIFDFFHDKKKGIKLSCKIKIVQENLTGT